MMKKVTKQLNEMLSKSIKASSVSVQKPRMSGGFTGGYGIHGDKKYNRRNKIAQKQKKQLLELCR